MKPNDALCLVFEGPQTDDPEKDDDETDAGHYNPGPPVPQFRKCASGRVRQAVSPSPSCTGTDGSRNALLLPSFVASTTHTAERRLPKKGETPRPGPFEDLTPISWLALLTDNFVAPRPDRPNGVALEPKLFVP
jgi:hypothetical protein